MYARYRSVDRLIRAANLRRRLGLGVEGFEVRRATAEKHMNGRTWRLDASGRGLRPSPQEVDGRQPRPGQHADLQQVTAADLIARSFTRTQHCPHRGIP